MMTREEWTDKLVKACKKLLMHRRGCCFETCDDCEENVELVEALTARIIELDTGKEYPPVVMGRLDDV